jgi:hypothetical protein
LEHIIEEVTRRIDEIHTSSMESLYTQNEEEYNQINRGDVALETK